MKIGITSGATGSDVAELQGALAAAGLMIAAGETAAQTFGPSTLAALHAFQQQKKLTLGDAVDAATAAALASVPPAAAVAAGTGVTAAVSAAPSGSVTGTLVDGDGAPVAKMKVSLFAEAVRAETHSGDATTDGNGAYSITYARPAARNLLARAYDAKGAVLATSATVFAAAAAIELDLTTAADGVIRAPSTYTTLVASVTAELGNIALADLKESGAVHEVQFVANALEVPFAALAQLYLAVVLAASHKLRADTLFGIFSQGIPSTLDAQLVDLPATGLDAAFTSQLFAGVLGHSRAALGAALTAAVSSDIVPASYAQAQTAQLDLLDTLRTSAAGAAPFGQSTTSLTDVLAAGSVSAAASTAFTAAYAGTGAFDAALAQVQSAQSVPAADLATLSNTLALGALLAGNAPLVKDTSQRIAQKSLANISDLALLAASDWSARITAVDPQAASIPPVTANETAAQKIARFSSQLASTLAASFPTTALRAHLASAQQSAFTTRAELVTVLAANPTLELTTAALDSVIAANKIAISPAALTELKTAQRLMRLTPVAANIEALKAAGFPSAQSIYLAGRTPFVTGMATALGGAAAAQQVFATAEMTYASALTTWAQFNSGFHRVSFKALPAATETSAEAQAQGADVEALLGSSGYFECQDCQSVVSPAAYLVDLLHYLQQFSASLVPTSTPAATPLTNARDALLLRRPEIQYLALDCTNTNVTLPYIDLVNEILEAFIADTTPPPTTPIETIGTAAERRALPQSIDPAAYTKTAGAVYPLTLPFDLPFTQTTAYVAALGTSRRALLERLHAPATAITEAALGLNAEMTTVITGGDAGHLPPERWGYAAADPDWLTSLGKVPTLLQRVGLTLPQLYQLLEAQWVTRGGVTLSLGTDSSGNLVPDLESMTFTGVTADVLDRAQRFLRLWTASGLAMWELDWALEWTPTPTTPQWNALDATFLDFVAGAIAVAKKLNVPLQEALTFWSPLETRDVTNHLGDEDVVVPSTYASVFANPTLQASWPSVFVSASGGTVALDGNPIVPASGGDLTNLSAVTAALGIGGADVAAVLAATGAANTLTLDTLAVLFRYARLARGLAISIADLLLWIQLAGELTSAMLGATPHDTLELLRRIAVLRGTGLAAADVDYLLRGGSAAGSSLAFTDTQAANAAQAITDAIAKLATPSDAPTLAAIAIGVLATAAGTTANVIAPLYPATATTPPSPATIAAIARGAALYTALHATEAEFAYIVANAAVFGWLDPSKLMTTATSPYAPFEALLRAVKLNHRQGARTPRLFDVLAAWQGPGGLPTDPDTAITGRAATSTSPALPSLATALGATSPEDVVALAAANALNATAPSLAAATQSGTLADMATLAAIADALDLAARYALNGAALVQLATAAPTSATAVAARGALQAQYPQDAWFAAIQPIEDDLRQQRRDALVAYLFNPTAPQPPLWTFSSVDDVFDYFLIDPEMCACSTTTRLLQASLAIQQYVQQVFLGLPIQYAIDTTNRAWSEWSWRQQFRLWQANREVFLYPENYLAPELRKDASPLFESLESDLRQNTVTADLAESAFASYLCGLVAASNLVVAAHYYDQRPDGSTVLYVFAHTRGQPYQWSYRARTAQSPDAVGAWSAWQSLGLDIPSDQVVPVIWDQRLHLVWPTFSMATEKAQPQPVPSVNGGNPTPATTPPAQTYWTIQFAISEFSAGQWQAKRVLDEKMYFIRTASAGEAGGPPIDINRPVDAFTFRASVDTTETLTISAYYNRAKAEDRTGNVKAGTAALGSLEAPLAIVQAPVWTAFVTIPDLTPKPTAIDLSQEPSFALVKTSSLGGSLAIPPGYNFFGQEWIAGSYDAPTTGAATVTVFAPASTLSTTATAQALLGQVVAPRVVVVPREAPVTYRDWLFVIDGGNGGLSASTPRPARTYLVDSLGAIRVGAAANGTLQVNGGANTFRVVVNGWTPQVPQLTISSFYHPFARTMLRELEVNGVAGLMARSLQTAPATTRGWTFDFKTTFQPTALVATPYPGQPGASDIGESGLDFTVGSAGAYSLYNWEIFYHAPMFVAELLMQNQQYSDAMTWLEYVFDPTDPGDAASPAAPQRFWETAPLNALTQDDWGDQQIAKIIANTDASTVDPVTATALDAYLRDPFDPDAIASLRISAYGNAAVMKFLDNLVAWGDSLFTTYTAETVNQAEQLYILADLILGPKPAEVRMPPQPATPPITYASLGAMGGFSDPLVAVENLILAPTPPQALVDGTGATTTLPTFPATAQTLLFCVPPNAKMLGYWDTVADRLYKIRHCLNLQGQAVPLPLYAPPINPLLATQAAAAGQAAGTTTPTAMLYRFATYLQRALDLTNDVRQFGALILSALEKEDAETLAVLRASQEVDIQQRLLDVKTKQVTEAQDQITALQNQKAIAQLRYQFYSTIEAVNAWETAALELQAAAAEINLAATVAEGTPPVANLFPVSEVGVTGFGGTPTVNIKFGGENIANAAASTGVLLHNIANLSSEAAGVVNTLGAYQRRADDWNLQKNLASAELTQIDSQITAANDRLAIAQSELSIQSAQIANAQAIQTFLTNKYTRADLYDWMVTQLTTVFTQAYQLAYSLAQKAQTAYQFELGGTQQFLQATYWDTQHRGLTAGESLLFDLRRMEAQYLDDNLREFELTKHVSLAVSQPLALLTLLQTGTCQIVLDETMFDADHPGHYFRRLRDVSLTVANVSGGYVGVNATLQLTSAAIRNNPAASPYKPATVAVLAAWAGSPADPNFVASSVANATVAISTGERDPGLFESNLRDERFLPFEARGAVSVWSLELNQADNAYDLTTVTDVVLHVRYTARAAEFTAATVRAALQALTPPLTPAVYVGASANFADAFDQFLYPGDAPITQQTLTFTLAPDALPFTNLGAETLTGITLYMMLAAPLGAISLPATFGPNGGTQSAITFTNGQSGGVPMLVATATVSGALPQIFELTVPTATIPTALQTTVNGQPRLDPTKIRDVALVVGYTE